MLHITVPLPQCVRRLEMWQHLVSTWSHPVLALPYLDLILPCLSLGLDLGSHCLGLGPRQSSIILSWSCLDRDTLWSWSWVPKFIFMLDNLWRYYLRCPFWINVHKSAEKLKPKRLSLQTVEISLACWRAYCKLTSWQGQEWLKAHLL